MASLQSLPHCVILMIAAHLKPRDLLSCSAVCKKWRERFNINAVWEPHLQLSANYYKIQENYKEMIINPPCFQTLEPLCVARENYIRDQYLHYNCRVGLFTIESFTPAVLPKQKAIVEQIIDFLDSHGNYWLFLRTNLTTEIWNITNKPFFHCCVPERVACTDMLYVFEMKFIAIRKDYVQVFAFEPPNYTPTFQSCFLLSGNNPSSNESGTSQSEELRHCVNDRFLIGYTKCITKENLSNTNMYIWSLETLQQLNHSTIIPERFMPYIIDFEEDDLTSVITFEFFKGDASHVIITLNEEDKEEKFTWRSSVMLFQLHPSRDLTLLRNLPRCNVVHSGIVDEHVYVIGFKYPKICFVGLIDRTGKVTAAKGFEEKEVNNFNQLSIVNKHIFIITEEALVLVQIENNLLIVSNVLNEKTKKYEKISGTNNFLFTSSSKGKIDIWDIEYNCQIKPLLNINGKMNLKNIIALKEVHFPPKVIYTNVTGTYFIVLSFW